MLSNLRFVVQVALKYINQGLDLEDLISEGQFGLIKAVDRYDPNKGFRLLTYAVWWIRQAILQALANQGTLVRIPMHAIAKKQKTSRKREELEQELRRAPTLEELQERLEFDIEALAYLSILSLDQKIKDGEKTELRDLVKDDTAVSPDFLLMEKVLKEDIKKIMDLLTDKEIEVLKLYHGIGSRPFTLEEIGGILGLTRERIRQIKEKGLYKMKRKGHEVLQPHLED